MSGTGRQRAYFRGTIARGLAGDRKWGLPPSKARQDPEALFPNRDLVGTVFRFDEKLQFGFAEFEGLPIERKNRGIFVHNSDVTSPKGGKMREGSRITAGVTQTEKGPRAVNIRIM